MQADDRLSAEVVTNVTEGTVVAQSGDVLVQNANAFIDIIVNADGSTDVSEKSGS